MQSAEFFEQSVAFPNLIHLNILFLPNFIRNQHPEFEISRTNYDMHKLINKRCQNRHVKNGHTEVLVLIIELPRLLQVT